MAKWGRRRFRKPIIFVMMVLIFSTALLVWVDNKITPIIKVVAAQRVHMAVVRIINEAVEESIGNELSYEDLVKIEKNEAGYVTLVQPDTIAVTKLTTSVSKGVEAKLSNLESEGISIPGGVISGMTLLANIGPNIHVDIKPVGQIDVSVKDEFVSVGVNQSKHKLNLDINTTMNVTVPFEKDNITVNVSLPLVETIIIGPVPNTYLNFSQ